MTIQSKLNQLAILIINTSTTPNTIQHFTTTIAAENVSEILQKVIKHTSNMTGCHRGPKQKLVLHAQHSFAALSIQWSFLLRTLHYTT